jgi:hypothetical protein
LPKRLNKILFVRVTDHDLMQLDAYCEDHGYTRAGFLRDMVRAVTTQKKQMINAGT